MKYIIQLHSKPEGLVEEKHKALLIGLQSLNEPWSLAGHISTAPDFGRHFYAIVSFNKYLPKHIKGAVHYRYRNMLEDTSAHDDYIYLDFNTSKVDFKYIVSEVLPVLIQSFNAYYGYVANEEIALAYFKSIGNKNLREELPAFYPVHFLSGKLCVKSLGLSYLDIKEKLENTSVQTQFINDGILIISSYAALDAAESIIANNYLHSLLHVP